MNGIFVNALLFQIANTFHCIVLHIICLGCIVSITAFSKQLYVQSVAIAYANVPYERQCSQIHDADSLRYAGVSDLEKKNGRRKGEGIQRSIRPRQHVLWSFLEARNNFQDNDDHDYLDGQQP